MKLDPLNSCIFNISVKRQSKPKKKIQNEKVKNKQKLTRLCNLNKLNNEYDKIKQHGFKVVSSIFFK